MKTKLLILVFLFLVGCNNLKGKRKLTADPIYRKHDVVFSDFTNFPEFKKRIKKYPWEKGENIILPKITKEFFYCKGSSLNPAIHELKDGKLVSYEDCKGGVEHGFSKIQNKRGIYPILIEILNYIQNKTKNKVVVTSGHRCPMHNIYCNRSIKNRTTKHLIGAEVDFYVQGLEAIPNEVLDVICDFYKSSNKYSKEYKTFEVLIPGKAWYNKEIMIRIFGADEERNFDNRHPYPYLSIEVRLDREKNEKVEFSFEKAFEAIE